MNPPWSWRCTSPTARSRAKAASETGNGAVSRERARRMIGASLGGAVRAGVDIGHELLAGILERLPVRIARAGKRRAEVLDVAEHRVQEQAREGCADHLREHGRLPDKIGGLWSCIPLRLIIKERGTDITLTEDEQLVYDAILRERRLPGGSVLLPDGSQTPILHYPSDDEG